MIIYITASFSATKKQLTQKFPLTEFLPMYKIQVFYAN